MMRMYPSVRYVCKRLLSATCLFSTARVHRASFHPITNRKHHCRLCGRIICSLPVKRGQRPVTCSLLFVMDPKTGQIEEVEEGVDYGVRKRTRPGVLGTGKAKDELGEDEKFLKGVRLCRGCHPVLLCVAFFFFSFLAGYADLCQRRQQYNREITRVPTFAKLYDAFIGLEREIEEALPIFQELLLTLRYCLVSPVFS
jgi:rabenosyn-5